MIFEPVSIGFVVVGALVWGVLWAVFLQFTRIGRFLAVRMTWITVVGGVGGTLLVTLPAVPLNAWLIVVAAFGGASIPIIGRSLLNEAADHREGLKDNER